MVKMEVGAARGRADDLSAKRVKLRFVFLHTTTSAHAPYPTQ